MATSPWYREGTAKFTQGSTTVTGTGTRWVDFVRAGDGIQGPDGKLYQVTNVASNTSLSITPAYGSETTYWTIPVQGYVKQLADAAAQLVRDFEGGAVEAIDAAERAKQSAIDAETQKNEATAEANRAGVEADRAEAEADRAEQAVKGFLKKSANLSDLTNPATARNNLGLGTAATRDVGEEAGNVLEVGAFGLGATKDMASKPLEDIKGSGFYTNIGQNDAPNSWSNTSLIFVQGKGDRAGASLLYRANARPYYYVRTWDSLGNSDGWAEVFHTRNFNPATKADLSGASFTGKVLFNPSTTTEAGLNLGKGTAPTTPVDGDMWSTGSAVQVRLGSTTRTLAHTAQWSLVPQAEAEAGTSTTSRLWSAQRVIQAIAAWWGRTGNQAKLDGIATGATKNATDAQLRDRATHTGEQPISTVTGLQSALDSKVDSTDSRLTNSREWTASVVSQAEAEAGTATTARKWTAQRVRQAIVAWWTTVGGAFGKTLLNSSDANAAKSSLGLHSVASSGNYNELSNKPASMSQAEANAGISTTARLISPKVLLDTISNAATMEIATTAQAQALTADDVVITPKKLGDAMNAHVLGMGQEWQNVTESRQFNVIYTNTTGRPIFVSVTCVIPEHSQLPQMVLMVQGGLISAYGSGSIISTDIVPIITVQGIIPAGSTYHITGPASFLDMLWMELL